MANKLYEETYVSDIADAIREKNGTQNSYTISQMGNAVRAITAKENVTWHQCPETVRRFLEEIEYVDYLTIRWKPVFSSEGAITYSSDSRLVSVTPSENGTAIVAGTEVEEGTLNTTASVTASNGTETKILNVRLDNRSDVTNSTVMSCVESTYVTVPGSKPVGITVDGVTYYNEVPGTETPFASENAAGTLMPLDPMRWLNTVVAPKPAGGDYALGNNVRDLGGWACDGGTVKYGMLVRGGEVNPTDKDLMVNEVGIRTELNLLPTNKQIYTESAWDIDYVANQTNIDFMYRTDIDNPAIKAVWKLYFDTIFDSVAHAKPVYFHCGYGADKTGTMSCALLGILGVSLSDIQKDFELTSFAYDGTNVLKVDTRRERYQYINLLIDNFEQHRLKAGLDDTFANRVISFALDCGCTLDQINRYRTACIDGTPTPIVVNRSVTNNLTNCSNNSSSQTVAEGESYAATISANSGYEMASVSVTMGGADVTSEYVTGYNINIPSVTGDIVITASATAHEATNLLAGGDGVGYFNNTRVSLISSNPWKRAPNNPGQCATCAIKTSENDVIRIKGFTYAALNHGICAFFVDATGTPATQTGLNNMEAGNTYSHAFASITISDDNIMEITMKFQQTAALDNMWIVVSGVCSDGANAFATRNEPLPN